MRLIDADKLIKDLSDLRKSPWANMPYISADRKFGISEALDMIESIVRCEQPTIDAIPIQYILTTIRQWNRDGYAESAEALEILVMNWDKEKKEWAEREEE